MRSVPFEIVHSIIKRLFYCWALLLLGLVASAQEMNIYPGCNFILQGNINVVVNNTAFKNNGSFSAGSSTVSFTGNADTTASYINGTGNIKFYNLTLDNASYGTAVKSAAGVRNILTISAGKLYADSNLTLLSDASNTARVAAIPAGATVLGKVMVERYIPARRAWRLLTAPVTSSSTIYNSWQNAGVYSAGKGILISGPGGTGLDNSNATSLKAWDIASQSLQPVTNTYAGISAGNTGTADNTGYFVFIRGDRNPNNFVIPNTNVTTITGIGALQTGTQVFTASASAGKYTLIGNPYASPIDFNALTRTNLVKRFYVWDPTLNTLGGYVTLDDLDNDGVYSKSVAGSAQTKEIQSSQAFFVETNSNGAASLTITESAKSSTNNLAVFRPLGNRTESIQTDLYLLNSDNSLVLADGTLAEYNDGFDEAVTNEDALKFTNINENISMLRNGTGLAIERRPLVNSTDTLFLKIARTTQRNYQLQITAVNFYHPELTAYFEDTYLHTRNQLDLSSNNPVNFAVDGNTASAAANRFRIVFKPVLVLPVAFSSVDAYLLNDNIKVDWRVGNEVDIANYTIERSVDGINFSAIHIISKNATGNYSYTDAAPVAGENFYRIKSTGTDGSIQYSRTVTVLYNKVQYFTVYPNPVKGHSINLQFANIATGLYQFNLVDNAGHLVYSNKLKIANDATSLVLNVNKNITAGTYLLQISSPSGETATQKLMIIQ